MRNFLMGVLTVLLPLNALSAVIYSIQLCTCNSQSGAERFLKRLPVEIRKEAFVYRTDSGLYTVRIWPSETIKELKKKVKYLRSLGLKSVSIVRTDTEKLKNLQKGREKLTGEREKENPLLLLLYQTYLANGKLRKALQVALKGTELQPNNPAWWERVAQVSRWLSERELLVKSLKKLVFDFKELSYARELFNAAVANYDFKTAIKVLETAAKYNLKLFTPKDAISLLYTAENPEDYIEKVKPLIDKSPEALRTIAHIYWFQGDLNRAEEIFKELKKKFGLKAEDYLSLSSILFAKKRYREALSTLKEAFRKGIKSDLILKNLSDLSWALGDEKTSIEASEELIKKKTGRIDDYMRLIYFYYNTQPHKAFKYAFEGWRRFKTTSLLLPLLNLSILTGNEKKLIEIVSKLSESKREKLLKNPGVLSLYAAALTKIGQKGRALKLLKDYLKRDPRPNRELLSELIYLLIDMENTKELRRVVKTYRNFEKEIPLPFVSAYLYLQNSNKALKLLKYVQGLKSDYNLLLMEADILELAGRENEARKIRLETLRKVKKEIERGNVSKRTVEAYLISLIYFSSPGLFEREFQKYRGFLSKRVAADIYYSYLLSRGREAEVLFRSSRNPLLKPWMRLNIALSREDLYSMEKLTKFYLDRLPIRDRITALEAIRKFGKAFHLAFKGLEENQYDNRLYRQFRDLVVSRVSHYYVDVSYQKRGSSHFYSLYNDLYIHIANSIYGGLKTESYFLSNPGSTFSTGNLSSHWFNLFIEKLFNNSSFRAGISGFKAKGESFFGFNFTAGATGFHQSSVNVEVYTGAPTDASEIAMLSAVKRGMKLNLSLPISNRLNLFSSLEKNSYLSAGGTELGDGELFYGEASFRLRTGYPDYLLRAYIQRNLFSEKDHSETLPDRIARYAPADVLPGSYYQAGVGVNFGSENRKSFVRVWRPYFSADLNYSSTYGWGSSITGGVGGSLLGKDNLHMELQLFKGFRGRGTSGFFLESGYRLWF